MPFNYNSYAPYRRQMTMDEVQRITHAEAQRRALEEQLGENMRVLPNGDYANPEHPNEPLANPVLNEFAAIAREHAEEQLAAAVNDRNGRNALPEDSDVLTRFPGIDPKGCYSAIDMGFAQRIAVINTTLQARGADATQLVQMITGTTKGREIRQQVNFKAQLQRTLQRAAKLCQSEQAAQRLQTQATAIETDLDVMQYDQLLQGIEHMIGVKAGPIPADVNTFYRDILKTEISPEMMKIGHKWARPEKLDVHFQDFDNQLVQEQFAKPENWGLSTAELEQLAQNEANAGAIESQITPYARATVGRVLDAAFNNIEVETAPLVGSVLDRGDHLIVDGKTPKEIIYEQYQQNRAALTGNYPSFEDYYNARGHELTSELVAGALMTGRRVEAIIPGPDGKLPAEPTQITKSGYEPSPLKKVTLNAWERFWSKRGFYKAKAAEAEEYKKFADARERVKLYNKIGQLNRDHLGTKRMKNILYGEWCKANNRPIPENGASQFAISRSTLNTMLIGDLLSKGHSLADIMDPSKLKQERLQSSSAIMEHIVDGADYEWSAELFHRAAPAVLQAWDAAASRLDLSDPNVIMQEGYDEFCHLNQVAFDLSQEINRPANKAVYVERYGNAEFDRNYTLLNDATIVGKYQVEELTAKCNLMRGGGSSMPTMDFWALAKGNAIRQMCAAKKQADPAQPFHQQFALEDAMPFASFDVQAQDMGTELNRQMTALQDELLANRDACRSQIASGEMNRRIQYKHDPAVSPVEIVQGDAPVTVKGVKPAVPAAQQARRAAAPAGPAR